ncbi:CHAT domain-containing protein [Trichoderma evansii]
MFLTEFLPDWLHYTNEIEDIDALIDLIWEIRRSPSGKLDYETFWGLERIQAMAEKKYITGAALSHINESIRYGRETTERIPKDHPNFYHQMYKLQNRLNRKYNKREDLNDLNETIEIGRAVVQNMCGEPSSPGRMMLQRRRDRKYTGTGDINDLIEAIEIGTIAIQHICGVSNTQEKIMKLLSLVLLVEQRFEQTKGLEDLNESIILWRELALYMPHTGPQLPSALSRLTWRLCDRYLKIKSIEDFEEATNTAKQALDLVFYSDAAIQAAVPAYVKALAMICEDEIHKLKLDEVISFARRCTKLTLKAHIHVMLITNAAILLEARYNKTGNLDDLEEAVHILQESLEVDHQDPETLLGTLGIMLYCRYIATERTEDLEKAIEITQKVITLTNSDSYNYVAAINLLSGLFRAKYSITGEIALLHKAIAILEQPLALGSFETHPIISVNLGRYLGTRFGITNEIVDLNEGIRLMRQGFTLLSEEKSEYYKYAIESSSLLQNLYLRTNNIAHIDEQISLLMKTLKLAPEGSRDQGYLLANLGTCLTINSFKSLGMAFLYQYNETRNIGDLAAAINFAEKATMLIPEDSPETVYLYMDLGNMFSRLFERTKEAEDREMALSFFLCGWNLSTARPSDRAASGTQTLGILRDLPEYGRAIDLGIAIINLLSKIRTRSLSLKDQKRVLAIWKGTASNLLALLLTNLINEIDSSLNTTSNGEVYRRIIQNRRHKVDELEECLYTIRTLPGYERFLLGKTVSELQLCAGEGIIIIVNIYLSRSDAVFISADSVSSIKLPQLFAPAEKWYMKDWSLKRPSEYYDKNKDYSAYLAWLWDDCVKHIVDKIKSMRVNLKQGLPKVWWIGGSIGNSMHFHAAGYHERGSVENAYSTVISSYTPSIKALEYSRSQLRRVKEMQPEYDNMLIALMPTTPKDPKQKKALKPFYGVLKEKDEIMAIAQDNLNTAVLDHPSAEQVLNALKETSIAHFACHGISEKNVPSNSGLVLQRSDGTDKHIQYRLTVQDITRLNLNHARIAYLSAYSTAENKANKIDDEVIHIVSGFQVAGFPHVVGCFGQLQIEYA